MRVLICSIIVLIAPAAASSADMNRIIALEQDVRNLERLVSSLEREVRELRQRSRGGAALGSDVAAEIAGSTSDAWVDAGKWRKIRLGASELEVIEILGRPTSMRAEGEERLLLYAMEIGSSGFLSGSVTMRNREVVAIEVPVLK